MQSCIHGSTREWEGPAGGVGKDTGEEPSGKRGYPYADTAYKRHKRPVGGPRGGVDRPRLAPRHHWMKTTSAEGTRAKTSGTRTKLWEAATICGGAPRILTRLTRLHTFEGPAFFSRELELSPRPGERVFLEAERQPGADPCRQRGRRPPPAYRGQSPPLMPLRSRIWCGREQTALPSAATTATLPGPMRPLCFPPPPQMRPRRTGTAFWGICGCGMKSPALFRACGSTRGEETADVLLELDCAVPYGGSLRISSEALAAPASREVSPAGGQA